MANTQIKAGWQCKFNPLPERSYRHWEPSNHYPITMSLQVLTTEDLEAFRLRLIEDIKELLEGKPTAPQKKWLKTPEVMEMLGISEVTLQTLRNNGRIPYSKLGGICYYDREAIDKQLLSLTTFNRA